MNIKYQNMKKLLAFVLFVFVSYTAKPQNINITSFQHSLRWLDEGSFPPYVNNDSIKKELLEITADAISHHFNLTVLQKPSTIEYRLINMFGKPQIKDPAHTNNSNDLQVAIFSFITRATSGFEVYWIMKIAIEQNGNSIYNREIKHQLKNYKPTSTWFTAEEFTDLFDLLFDELVENRAPMGELITMGNKPEDKDSTLRANAETWRVDKNKELFGFAKPSFGPYSTIEAGKTDSATIKSKAKVGGELSFSIEGGKLYMDNGKLVDIDITKFCSLLLNYKSTDSVYSYFVISTNERKEKQTALGLVLKGNNEGHGNTLYYDRNVKGLIRISNQPDQWSFSLEHYVNGEINDGYLKTDKNTLRLKTTAISGTKKEIVVYDEADQYLAAMVTGFSSADILLRKDIAPDQQKAIATLFAIMISIKNLPDK